MILSVIKACKLLKIFTHKKNHFTIKELHIKLGYSLSTINRLCTTLEKEGFLIKDNKSNYHLSPRIFEFASIAIDDVTLKSLIYNFMKDIVRETGESVALYIRVGFNRVCIEKYESANDLRQVLNLGQSLPLCVGASGKILLAWMPEDLKKNYFNFLRNNPPDYFKKNINDLKKELEIIKKHKISFSVGERVIGSNSVSVPIFKRNGEVLSIAVTGPSIRMDDSRIQDIKNILIKYADKINKLFIAKDL